MICAYYDRIADSRGMFENLKLSADGGRNFPGQDSQGNFPGQDSQGSSPGQDSQGSSPGQDSQENSPRRNSQENNSPDKMEWDRYLNQFDVIRLVMTDFIKKTHTVPGAIRKLTGRILEELEEAYPGVKYDSDDFIYSMEKFYRKSGVTFVIVIDEWDAVFRVRKEDKEGQVEYLNFLRDWLKDKTYIALAYMTGILPIKN